jgi:hypothetical protein
MDWKDLAAGEKPLLTFGRGQLGLGSPGNCPSSRLRSGSAAPHFSRRGRSPRSSELWNLDIIRT